MKYKKSFITCPNCELREEKKVPEEIKRGKEKVFIACKCRVTFEVRAWQFENVSNFFKSIKK